MRKFRPTMLAGALALALTAGTASAQFTNTYIFGDSLSDAGVFGSRFTTNPGLTAPMYVGQNWGITSTPFTANGNDWAIGGARVNTPQGNLPAGLPDLSITAQVNTFLAKGPLDRNALYQIQGGANDIFQLAPLYAANPAAGPGSRFAGRARSRAPPSASSRRPARSTSSCQEPAGHRQDAAGGIPGTGQGQALFNGLSTLFNSTLNAAIGAAGLNVIQFNAFALANEIRRESGAVRVRQRDHASVHHAEYRWRARRPRWSRPTPT